MNFEELKLMPPLLKALDRQWFKNPTEIQEKVIPLAINWDDVLWCAKTWSWKTLSFALPMLNNLYNKRLEEWVVEWKIKRKIQALIIAPTRELAAQIWEDIAPYCTNTNFKHTVIFGWVNDFHQKKAIEKWVDILIATPGRLEDLISQAVVKLSYVEILTLDEADRMLDMGFLWDIKKVIKRIPKDRQTFFFSATMPKPIRELANSLQRSAHEITIDTVTTTNDNITEKVYHVKSSHRRKLLQNLVKNKSFKSIVIFVKTKDDTEYVLDYVKSAWISADNIHRNRSQNARQRALNALKKWEIKVLVATDIASRWLDVDDLSCVINYNIPSEPETYIHRIWRTWRAWKKWLSITICTDKDKENLQVIEKLTWKKLEVEKDDSYLDEVIPKWKKLGYTNFDEWFKKEKKTRKSVWKKRYYGKKK